MTIGQCNLYYIQVGGRLAGAPSARSARANVLRLRTNTRSILCVLCQPSAGAENRSVAATKEAVRELARPRATACTVVCTANAQLVHRQYSWHFVAMLAATTG